MLRISTLDGHKRMSTQELSQKISEAVAAGETEFQINASGQHDIGGPVWSPDGSRLRFLVTNPGQRVGCMCLPGTLITVDGPAPADVGWLNAGGTVVVKGDAGDTAGHCAAGGKIFIGGRAGTRTGSLMKHDPEHEPPQLWILKNAGSFSFEFMGGGCAVVCGHECLAMPSALGERPCVGMVGGVVYFRGAAPDLPPDVIAQELDGADIDFLDSGLDEFLHSIAKPALKRELSIWKHWRKLVPDMAGHARRHASMAEFHANSWIPGGIFGDVLADDMEVVPLVAAGEGRLREPHWKNENGECTDCGTCLKACPKSAVKRRTAGDADTPVYSANSARCIGCGICAAVCPHKVWQIKPLA